MRKMGELYYSKSKYSCLMKVTKIKFPIDRVMEWKKIFARKQPELISNMLLKLLRNKIGK